MNDWQAALLIIGVGFGVTYLYDIARNTKRAADALELIVRHLTRDR